MDLGLPDHLKIFQGHFVFQEIRWTTFTGVRRAFSHLEIGAKNPKMLENLKSASRFRLIYLILAITLYLPALTLHKSQLHCSGVMQWRACSSLMSTPSPADSHCETCERIVTYMLRECT